MVMFLVGSQPSALTQWAPLLGSLVVAFVTFLGIRWNNNTNRAAISASDERELQKWRRDTLIRLTEEISGAQREVDFHYNRDALQSDDPKYTEHQRAVWVSTRRLGQLSDGLMVIGEEGLASGCKAIQKAAWAIRDPAKAHREVLKANPGVDLPDDEETRVGLDKAIGEMNTALGTFVKAAQKELNRTVGSANSPALQRTHSPALEQTQEQQ